MSDPRTETALSDSRNVIPFVVEIQYREPGYELRFGARAQPYRFRYRLEAASAELAAGLAMSEFRQITEISRVGWIRDVVQVLVIPVVDDGGSP